MIYFRVRDAAKQAGLKPSALIRRAGVSPTVGMKLLHNSGDGKPSGPPVKSIHIPSLLAVAKVLGVNPLDLMEYREGDEP